jgi:glyoxylase-like metal-dependent hydrolase (beta-lactamase superfamily II)
MQVTGTRQREAWLRREFPPVEEVTSGVWSVPVPIPDSPLRYVLSYLIEHRSGFVMVDTGWDHPDSWRVLTAGLQSCGIPLTAITGIVITHVHPDHHGLSRAVREQSGAWIGMHEREDAFLAAHADWTVMQDSMRRYLRWCGAPPEHLADMADRRAASLPPGPMARTDRVIAHGDLIDAPGLALRALWTPGHSPGHLYFHDESRRLLLTGDHVLPRITPNISAYDMTSSPLDDYLQSLAALRGIEPGEVLPAHEYRFADLDGRLADLAAHHEERLTEITEVLSSARAGQSAWQVAAQISWSRPWDQLRGFPRQAALGEVVAHLRHLQLQGWAECADADCRGLWGPVPGAAGDGPAAAAGHPAVNGAVLD